MNQGLITLVLCFLIPVTLTSGPYVTNSGMRISPIFPHVPKTYDINLDASYEEQWKAILADFEPSLLHYADSLGLSEIIPFDLLDQVDYSVVEAYDKEFAEEMKAISGLLSLSFSEIVLLNFIYDFTARCTSLIIQDDEGNVYHGRNLDFPDSEELSRMTFHGKYYKNGKLLYEAISLAGYSGLVTGLKPNAYSFSINQYLPNDTVTPTTWDDITTAVSDLVQLLRRKLSPPLLAKRAFETIGDYDELVAYLNSTEVVSNVFYFIAGTEPGQGTVMTRYRTSVENITRLNVDAGDWYVVQTNYVGNAPDPAFDNRVTAASDWLNSIGRSNITKELLMNQVLTVYPVFNNETIHTTIMQPKTGYFNTTIWGWRLDN